MRRPDDFIGAGTCGLGAGAKETLAAVHAYLDGHEINADVVMVGCIGLCSLEPLVDIQLPGRARVSFQMPRTRSSSCGSGDQRGRGTADPVASTARLASNRGHDVPYVDEHPFFAPQTRWVLANCGMIDPSQIDEYIARGGYQALVAMLREA